MEEIDFDEKLEQIDMILKTLDFTTITTKQADESIENCENLIRGWDLNT